MDYPVKTEGKFSYVEQGKGDILLLLHGLFGGLSNFKTVIDHFSKHYKVVVPLLPVYTMPLRKTGVKGLMRYVHRFIKHQGYKQVIFLGNSLGGHVALVYALEHPDRTKAIVLTGSSGLFENTLGGSYPKKGDYDYIKEKTAYTFYDPDMATPELVDEVYETVNNRAKVLRLIAMSRSAMKHNLGDDLPHIKAPVCLIWGQNDRITPPHVAEEFHKLLPNSVRYFIDKCGHAPMMERPEQFNVHLESFLEDLRAKRKKEKVS